MKLSNLDLDSGAMILSNLDLDSGAGSCIYSVGSRGFS